ncbi:unnamed protein product, partial [Amoebophrya sp. A25]
SSDLEGSTVAFGGHFNIFLSISKSSASTATMYHPCWLRIVVEKMRLIKMLKPPAGSRTSLASGTIVRCLASRRGSSGSSFPCRGPDRVHQGHNVVWRGYKSRAQSNSKQEDDFNEKNDLPPPVKTKPPPPFPIRVALVATSAGLFTPVSVFVGAGVMWSQILPQSPIGRFIKNAGSFAGVFGAFSLLTVHVGPWLWRHGDLVLPFAISNALTAGFWYAVLEKKIGLTSMAGLAPESSFPAFLRPFVRLVGRTSSTGASPTTACASSTRSSGSGPAHSLGLPLGGLSVGMLTASTAFMLYPLALDACLSSELREFLFPFGTAVVADLYTYLLLPVGLPCGVCAGYAVQMLLGKTIAAQTSTRTTAGASSSSWSTTRTAYCSPYLILAQMLFLFCVYSGRASMTKSVDDLKWEVRLDSTTGKLYSWNPASGERSTSPDTAQDCEVQRNFLSGFRALAGSIPQLDRSWFQAFRQPLPRVVQENKRSLPNAVQQDQHGENDENSQTFSWTTPPRLPDLDAHQRLVALVDALSRLQKVIGRQSNTGVTDPAILDFLQRYALHYDVPFSELQVCSLSRVLADFSKGGRTQLQDTQKRALARWKREIDIAQQNDEGGVIWHFVCWLLGVPAREEENARGSTECQATRPSCESEKSALTLLIENISMLDDVLKKDAANEESIAQ